MANHKLASHIADASFYKFKSLLENKAKIYGGVVEKDAGDEVSSSPRVVRSVSQWFPSSKLYSQCQRKKTDLKLKDRLYICDSPFCQLICRDLNSALNLANVPKSFITTRVGSTRINARGHRSADTYDLKREKNTLCETIFIASV